MTDPTIRRLREEEQRKWREQRRLKEEAEQRHAANVSRNEQDGRDSQRLTALEREWRTFKPRRSKRSTSNSGGHSLATSTSRGSRDAVPAV
jgi:hypothetical protein